MSNQILSKRKSPFPLKLVRKHAANLHFVAVYVTQSPSQTSCFERKYKCLVLVIIITQRLQVLTSGLFSRNGEQSVSIFIFCTESNWAPVMKASQSKNALMINAQNPLIFVIPFLSLDLCRHVLMKTIKHKQSTANLRSSLKSYIQFKRKQNHFKKISMIFL